jgi:hypothetical protein
MREVSDDGAEDGADRTHHMANPEMSEAVRLDRSGWLMLRSQIAARLTWRRGD